MLRFGYVVLCVVLGACASAREVGPPSRDEVLDAARLGWVRAGRADPMEACDLRVVEETLGVDTLRIRQAVDREQYETLCWEEGPGREPLFAEERMCLYWSLEGGMTLLPIVLLREDVALEEWGPAALHGVLHFFFYCALYDGDVSLDAAHLDHATWGPGGAEEVSCEAL